jgi:hypothetical protein
MRILSSSNKSAQKFAAQSAVLKRIAHDQRHLAIGVIRQRGKPCDGNDLGHGFRFNNHGNQYDVADVRVTDVRKAIVLNPVVQSKRAEVTIVDAV